MTAATHRKLQAAALAAYPLPPRLAALLDCFPLDLLAFAPVPVQARRDGWTPGRQVGFILRLALCGDVAASARGVGMSRESAWRLRRRVGAESFAGAWDTALGWGVDRMSDLALERSLAGEVRAIHYRGRKIGERTHFDNGLALAVLRRFPRAPRSLPPGEDWGTAFRRALDAICPEKAPLESNDFVRDFA